MPSNPQSKAIEEAVKALKEIQRKKLKVEIGHYCQARSSLDGAVKLAENALTTLKALASEGDATEFTFEDAQTMLRGAVEVYGGGYQGIEREAYTNGIRTALNVLEMAKRGDTQTQANLNIGRPPSTEGSAVGDKP